MQKEICIESIDPEVSIVLTKGKRAVGTLGSHFHCGYTAGMLAEGEAELIYGENRVKLTSGSLYLMDPFKIHRIKFLIPSEYYVINMKAELVKAMSQTVYLENMYRQDEKLTAVLIDIYKKLSSNEMTSIQKQMTLKYLIEILENEQQLTI